MKFELGVGLKEFQGEDGKVTGVVLSNDKVVEADVCVLGIGVVPATAFLKDSGLNLTQRGEVVVDQVRKQLYTLPYPAPPTCHTFTCPSHLPHPHLSCLQLLPSPPATPSSAPPTCHTFTCPSHLPHLHLPLLPPFL